MAYTYAILKNILKEPEVLTESQSKLTESLRQVVFYCFMRDVQGFGYIMDRPVFITAHSENLLTFFGQAGYFFFYCIGQVGQFNMLLIRVICHFKQGNLAGIGFPYFIGLDIIEYLVFYGGKQVGRERMSEG